MRMIRAKVVVAMATAVLIAPPLMAVATASDVGNGSSSCGTGELCYSKDYPATSYQRDYYYSGNDSESP
ncbi:MAG TPA: hypothetical protein VJ831_05880, partial [Jatrophihabitantaceae bacterium]|nr:hypothetical protein [Jatrophihabitantaceae bacterium]